MGGRICPTADLPCSQTCSIKESPSTAEALLSGAPSTPARALLGPATPAPAPRARPQPLRAPRQPPTRKPPFLQVCHGRSKLAVPKSCRGDGRPVPTLHHPTPPTPTTRRGSRDDPPAAAPTLTSATTDRGLFLWPRPLPLHHSLKTSGCGGRLSLTGFLLRGQTWNNLSCS